MALSIQIENNLLKIEIKSKLTKDDFIKIGDEADKLIKMYGKIHLLLNAHDFHGWENFSALKTHLNFVKNHHEKVEKIAFIPGYMWQRCLIYFVSILVEPEIKVFDKNRLSEALDWLKQSNS